MKVTGGVISQVRPDHLRLPTPCADWTLAGLLRHLVSEDTAFAAATTAGTGWSDVDWNAGRLGADPVADYHRAAAAYLAAFEPDAVLDKQMRVNIFGVVPGSQAVAMHFIDTVVHGWDIARTVGVPYRPDEDLVAVALKVMRGFPVNRSTGAFAEVRPVPDDASELDELIAFVGRDPHWA